MELRYEVHIRAGNEGSQRFHNHGLYGEAYILKAARWFTYLACKGAFLA